jgi:regulator of sirC expression with transglutaminase-like and TPR domain
MGKNIATLLKLLDDSDINVVESVKNKLIELGEAAIPYLEKEYDNCQEITLQQRIEKVILNIKQNKIKHNLKNWDLHLHKHDLLTGLFIVSQFQYPDYNFNPVKEFIEKIKKDIWLELNDDLTAFEKITVINHILFNNYKLSVSHPNMEQFFFINSIFENRNAAPVMFTIFYAALCQQLNLPVYGVILPDNFILCYNNTTPNDFEDFNSKVLFYINPANKGIVFGRDEIENYLNKQNSDMEPDYFLPVENKTSIINLIENIIAFFHIKKKKTKIEEFSSLLKNIYI